MTNITHKQCVEALKGRLQPTVSDHNKTATSWLNRAKNGNKNKSPKNYAGIGHKANRQSPAL